jgi:Fe2+ transport system protein B
MILLNIAGGMFALLVGLVFSKTLFRKQKTFFIIEMVD